MPAIVVLGLDPGTLVTGYGIVSGAGSRMTMLARGTIRNLPSSAMADRLEHIYAEICTIIRTYRPGEFAIESAFYGKNAQSALKLGHARGVAMLAAVQSHLPVSEYSPREVKKAIVGTGSASKEQVRFMVCSLLGVQGKHMTLDASDALAIAICRIHRMLGAPVKKGDWSSFVRAHPEKVAQ